MSTERKSTSKRGYGKQHQKLRKRLLAELEAFGHVPCVRCGAALYSPTWAGRIPNEHVKACASKTCSGDCWLKPELDHTDDRTGWQGLAHACCNRRAGGGAHAIVSRTPMISRSW